MGKRSKLLLAGLTAAFILSAAVGTASANRLSVDEQGFRIVWTSLEFTAPELGVRILCPVTLEGSFHSRTIVKTLHSLIGHVTRAIINGASPPCTGGTATVLTENLPWHVTYEGFGGTLPIITSVRVLLIGARFRIDPSGILPSCLATTTTTEPISGTIRIGREAGGELKSEELIPGSERILCSSALGELTGGFQGNGNVTRLGASTRILVRLI